MFELRSPIDSEILVGRFASASRQDVRDAIAAARAAQPGWAALGWDARIARLRQAAELISERQMEYALANAAAIAEAAGTSLDQLCLAHVCYDDLAQFAPTMETWRSCFAGDLPAATALGMAGPLLADDAHVLLDLIGYVR